MLNLFLKVVFFFIDGFITVSIGFSPILFIFSLLYFDELKDTLNYSTLAIIIFITSNIFYSISQKAKQRLKI